MKIWYLAISFILTGFVFTGCAAKPADPTRPVAHFGKPNQTTLPKKFLLLNWNVHKGRDKTFAEKYAEFARQAQLVTLQEMSTVPSEKNGTHSPREDVEAVSGLGYSMAEVLFYDPGYAGVATGASAPALKATKLLSPDNEPVIGTGKGTLLTTYQVDGSPAPLLVGNTHGMNAAGKLLFGHDSFSRQLNAVAAEIRKHRGPVIWAGDFNSHDKTKTAFLMKLTADLGLIPVSLKHDEGLMRSSSGRVLDYVFVRGLTVISSWAGNQNDGSDHAPIQIELRVP